MVFDIKKGKRIRPRDLGRASVIGELIREVVKVPS